LVPIGGYLSANTGNEKKTDKQTAKKRISTS
jgi:hypothetical protein